MAFHRLCNTVHPRMVPLQDELTLFLAISKGLKLPFSKEFLASDGFAAHFVCAARYAIASFVTIGVYPMVFKHTDRFIRRDV